jgi:hypothetical protein
VEVKHRTFEKGHEPIFDDELYVITAVFRGDPNMYSLRVPGDGDDMPEDTSNRNCLLT